MKDEGNLILWDEVHFGISTATDGGLVVPVLENADRMTLEDVARQVRLIVHAAREGRQTSTAPARFTISNPGMFGVDNFAAIINPPETAILSGSAMKPTVIPARDGTLQFREVMNVTMSMDHRGRRWRPCRALPDRT